MLLSIATYSYIYMKCAFTIRKYGYLMVFQSVVIPKTEINDLKSDIPAIIKLSDVLKWI